MAKVGEVKDQEYQLADTLSVLKAAVEAEELNLSKLQNLIMQDQLLLKQQRDQHGRNERDHAQRIRQREIESDKVIASKDREWQVKSQNLEQADKELIARQREAKTMLEKADSLREQQRQLTLDRAQVEKLKLQSQHDASEAARKHQQIDAELRAIAPEKDQLKRDQAATNALKEQLNVREGELDKLQKDLAAEQDNIKKLRKELEPQLEQLASSEKNSAEKLKAAQAIHAEAMQRHAENEQKLAILAEKATKLRADQQRLEDGESSLKQRLQGLKVREAIAKK